MGKKDARVDEYIRNAAPFAQPILRHLRSVVHEACPDVEETIKWSVPHFDYKGPMCNMAAFKAHCAFGLWKASLILDDPGREAMGHFGRITTVEDLPPRATLKRYLRRAMELNDTGEKAERVRKEPKAAIAVPDGLAAALKRNKKARAAFEGFPPSHRREYLEWITEAKTDATRDRRIAQAVEWMAEGKTRNWKYEPKPRSQ
jgi:uncharacterized protein YdeI (YjbR/CyaY-like superfamily)